MIDPPVCPDMGGGADEDDLCNPSLGFVLPTGDAPLAAFSPVEPYANGDPCIDSDGLPAFENNVHTDFLPINTERPQYAVTYPYRRHIRLFDAARCTSEPEDVIQFPLEGPGPVAMDRTADGRTLAVALWNPQDPCGAGAVATVALPSGEITGMVETPRGASDIVVLDTEDGPTALVTLPGDDGCIAGQIGAVNLDVLRDEGEAFTIIPVPGTNTTRAHRIARTRDRQWASWVTSHRDTVLQTPGGGGRVSLIHAGDLAPRTFGPLDFPRPEVHDWDGIADVAVITENDGVRIYFVYEFARGTNRNDYWDDCQQRPTVCSGLRWLRWDGVDASLSGERTLPYASVRQIGVASDRRSAFITHAGGNRLVRWDLGSGVLDNFLWDPDAGLTGVDRPGALWLP